MKKVKKKDITLLGVILALLIAEWTCLVPYQSPQVVKTVDIKFLRRATQIKGTSVMLLTAHRNSGTIINSFDVLDPDFYSNKYRIETLFADRLFTTRETIAHPEDPDIVFVMISKLYVCQISTQIIKSGPLELNLSHGKLLKGTNFFYTAGFSGRVFRYDYTTDPLVHDARHVYGAPGFRCVSLLDNSQYSPREIAWGADGIQHIWFFDRTGDLSTTTRKYDFGATTDPQDLYEFMAKNKLIYLESRRNELGSVDYSQATITGDYTRQPCGAGVKPSSLAVIDLTTQGYLVCGNTQIKLMQLSDGTEISTTDASAVHAKGSFAHILEGKRILFVYGETSTPNQFAMSLWDIKDKIPCHSSCTSCEFDATATGCKSCPPGKVLRLDGSCADRCAAENEYVDSSRKCKKCDSTCRTCSAGGPNHCTSCPDPKFKKTDNSCKDSCSTREFDAGSRICKLVTPLASLVPLRAHPTV